MEMDVLDQMCLFTMELPDEAEAVSMWTGDRVKAEKPAAWMLQLVPDGEYVLDIGGKYPMVLRPVPYGVDGIQECHEFMHYLIDQKLYAGIFVGRGERENTNEEEAE